MTDEEGYAQVLFRKFPAESVVFMLEFLTYKEEREALRQEGKHLASMINDMNSRWKKFRKLDAKQGEN